jgi:hypothetical protein
MPPPVKVKTTTLTIKGSAPMMARAQALPLPPVQLRALDRPPHSVELEGLLPEVRTKRRAEALPALEQQPERPPWQQAAAAIRSNAVPPMLSAWTLRSRT